MSWLDNTLDEFGEDVILSVSAAAGEYKTIADLLGGDFKNAKGQITTELLNLIEQSKEKSLPLSWLAGEIKKL